MTQPIFTDFEPRHAQLFGKHNVNLGHRLHESDLFSDASLAPLDREDAAPFLSRQHHGRDHA